MKVSLPAGVEALRRALEERADLISSAAQMVLESFGSAKVSDLVRHDLARICESATEVYRIVHAQLTAAHFAGVESGEDELHRIRHDLRGLLQNILLRSQMVLEESEAAPPSHSHSELQRIVHHAKQSVDALNTQRDEVHGNSERVLDSEETAPTPAVSIASTGSSPAVSVADARILIADDNENSREMLARFLIREGHTVAEAATGREALEQLQRADFDLLLLDLVMPELNGFEVLEALRRNGMLRHLPVIVISGLDTDANALRGIELGADDFLPRPVDLKLLRARANAAIERRRLREKELAAYFTPELARYLLRHPEKLTRGRSVAVSVLFCDIVGFSRISERLGAERSIRWVGDVLSAMSRCVMDEEGVLVDYTGDEVMAMWGAPGQQPDHAERACRCAMAMRRALGEIDAEWKEIIGEPTEVSIGVNTGEVFVGNIGTPQKFKFGALGTPVNLASRVQSATKFVRCRVLITGETRRQIGAGFRVRKIGRARVNNIQAPVELHELIAGGETEAIDHLRERYEAALVHFEKCEFRESSKLLGELLLEFPDDGPSLVLLSRVVHEMLHNEEPFDAVWTLPGK